MNRLMKAVRVHRFGGLEAIVYEEVRRPAPGAKQVLVRVRAAGVGPWDAWVRAGKSAIPQPLPLILGADLSGIVEDVGAGVISSVAKPDKDKAAQHGVRGMFFIVTVTSEGLSEVAHLLDSGQLSTNVGEVLPLAEARLAHEMLAGKPHKRRKIVLSVSV